MSSAEVWLDPIGNDANDGLSAGASGAKKTVAGINAIISGFGNLIHQAYATYKTSDGEPETGSGAGSQTDPNIWTSDGRGDVTWVDNTPGPFVSKSDGNRGLKFAGCKFVNLDDTLFENTNGTSTKRVTFQADECTFTNCKGIFINSVLSGSMVLTFCTFDSCGAGLPMFTNIEGDSSVEALDTAVTNCTFFNCNVGANNLLIFQGDGDEYGSFVNNVFSTTTAGRILFTSFAGTTAFFDTFTHNTFHETTDTLATGFAKIDGVEEAALSDLIAGTNANATNLSQDPNLAEPTRRCFVGDPGGNIDRTGFGNVSRGSRGIGFFYGTPVWDGGVITPAGELTETGGNYEHTGNDAVAASAVLPDLDMSAIYTVKKITPIVSEDGPEGVVDKTLGDSVQTFGRRSTTSGPTSGAYTDTDNGEILNEQMKLLSCEPTLRNDGT